MQTYAFGPFRLNVDDARLTCDGSEVPLGPKVVETLAALIERAGQTCTKRQLTDRIWPEGFIDEASLVQNVYVLRKTLGRHWRAPAIETVRHRGYRFIAPLDREPATDRAVRHVTWRARGPALFLCALLALIAVPYSPQPARGTTARLAPQDARLYALGRFYWNSRTRDGVLRSVDYFKRVIRSEPSNALAYSGLADAYFILADYHFGPESAQTYHRWERQDAERALSLNPNLSEAHASLAQIRESVDRDFPGAQAEYARAIELDPNNATAHHWFGIMLMMQGRTDASRGELETAAQLDPTSPSISEWLAIHSYFAHRYRAAISYLQQALDLKPTDDDAAGLLGLAYEQSHNYAAALRTYRRSEALCRCASLLVMEARTHALLGEFPKARALLAQAKRSAKKGDLDSLALAATLIALGRRDEALSSLRAYPRADELTQIWLALDPRLDPVRNDPRFSAVLGASRKRLCAAAC